MTVFLLYAAAMLLAYLLQLHVLPVLGWALTTPELLFALCAVGAATRGPGRIAPLALLFGVAADLALGFGYGMFSLGLALAVLVYGRMGEKALARPGVTALLVGFGAMAARLLRAALAVFLGRGFFPVGTEWLWLAASGVFTAAFARLALFVAARRMKREEEERYLL